MKIEDIRLAVDLCIRAQITPFLWGKHGLGKSSSMRDLCFMNDWGFVDERLAQSEASDIRGLPAKDLERHKTVYYAPETFPVGDMSIEAICKELATCLGQEVPEAVGAISPLKVMRLAVRANRMWSTKGGKLFFDGDPFEYNQLRLFGVRLKQLQPRFPQGIFFLDEMNRAEDDVLQASFELVLDRTVGMHVLPPGWGVVAAGNFTEGYNTNPMIKDPALIDRFCHLTLSSGESTLDDWAQWMMSEFGPTAQRIIEFGLQNVDNVDGKSDVQNDIAVQPSRRSWAMIAQMERVCESMDYPEEIKRSVIAGLVGDGLAISYMKYTCPVKPKDLVEYGLKPQMAALRKIANDARRRGILGGLMYGVLSFAQGKLNKKDPINNCFDFAEFLVKEAREPDLAVAFMRSILGSSGGEGKPTQEQDAARSALLSNTKLAALVGMHKRRNAGSGMEVIDEFNARPALQKLMQEVTWGNE